MESDVKHMNVAEGWLSKPLRVTEHVHLAAVV